MDGDHQFSIYQKLPGGKKAAMALIERQTGKRPTINTANVWSYQHKKIPAKFVVLLERECRRLGIETEPSDFISKGNEHVATQRKPE